MYLERFGLNRLPFPATPDSGSYYPATEHEHALAELFQALQMGAGMLLLSGDAGTGKTLLCHCLIERLPPTTTIAFLTNSRMDTRRDLLQALLYDLSLPYEAGTEQELRIRLTDYLLNNHAAGKQAVFLIDEAHHLNADALEELRMLSNLEAGRRKAVQVIFIAQPAFLHTLGQPQFLSLNQRLAVRVQAGALDTQEAIDYVLHHLRIAGGQGKEIFTDEALEILAQHTNGIPRLLNQAAHQALLAAHQIDVDQVDAEVMLDVLTGLGWVEPITPTEENLNPEAPADHDEGIEVADKKEDVLSYDPHNLPRRLA